MRVGLLSSRPLIVGLVQAAVGSVGGRVAVARHWTEMASGVAGGAFDAAIFDCPRPCGARHLHCSLLCRTHGVPFVLVSGDPDPLAALEARRRGAWEVFVAPFFAEDLVEVLRRLAAGRRGDRPRGSPPFGILTLGPELAYDRDCREVSRRGLRQPLTPREARLLDRLLAEEGKVVPVGDLIEAVWGRGSRRRGPDLYHPVRALRRKLGDDPPRLIQNVYGCGYVLARMPGAAEVAGMPGTAGAGAGIAPESACGLPEAGRDMGGWGA